MAESEAQTGLRDATMKSAIFLLLSVAGAAATAGETATPPCTRTTPTGTICEARIDDLRPTQFGVGMLEVEQTRRELAGKSPAGLRKTILKKRIAVVIGPDGRLWLVDRHHLSRALAELGEARAPVFVVGRIDDHDRFWPVMKESHWAWLRDERGNPRDPEELPGRVRDLPDYPYRSLAGFAKDRELFRKPGRVYFIEFEWARYFGDRLGWAEITAANLPQRLEEAKRVACEPEAAALPGYPGRACATR